MFNPASCLYISQIECGNWEPFSRKLGYASQDACSGAWHKQELFLATPSEIHCVLIAAADEIAEPYIEVITRLLCPLCLAIDMALN